MHDRPLRFRQKYVSALSEPPGKITSGHVVVDGHPMLRPNTNINKVRENIGMVFQHFTLFPHLTVKENITLLPRN